MELKDIFALLDRFDGSSAAVLELEMDKTRLRLEKPGVSSGAAPRPAAAPAAAAPAAVSEAPAPSGTFLKAPLVGTFYASPAPGEPPFVKAGDTVKKGQTVCVLEAMKMMSEVPAPWDCVIEEVLMQDGDLAAFDAPLFRVREL